MDPQKYIGNSGGVAMSIVSTLAYSEVFSHPLTLVEICERSPYASCYEPVIRQALDELVACGLVQESRGYYFPGAAEAVVNARIEANLLAEKRMRAARFYSSIISRFPYVRSVMISGSLSKGVMEPDDDIDFFIVTKTGRIWITRMLLTLFKRVFLMNSHRNFCINYFIDNSHLQIPDQNLFTATEVGTLLPMYNRDLYLEFLAVNGWYRDYYPNLPVSGFKPATPSRVVGRLIERAIPGRLADLLDDFCLGITQKFLARKYHNLKPERFKKDLETTKSVSKHHPNQQQIRILGRHREILDELEMRMKATVEGSGNSVVHERIA
jgi:hypothetical protein